jgi:ankyrin repeat protein
MSRSFGDLLAGLRNGDFSRLEPYFDDGSFLLWYREGRLRDDPEAIAEALTCACFLGKFPIAERLIADGVAPAGGNLTGLNAIHWAADRGQLDVVRLLIRHGVDLEFRNMYGGTVLGMTTWSAGQKACEHHPVIVEELLRAGARVEEADFPSGHPGVDRIVSEWRLSS